MKETDMYELQQGCCDNYRVCIERVENPCSPGMPDVYGRAIGGTSFWIENKVCGFEEKLKIRQDQIIWLRNHSLKYQGLCYIVIHLSNQTHNNFMIINCRKFVNMDFLLNSAMTPDKFMQFNEMVSITDNPSIGLPGFVKIFPTMHEVMGEIFHDILYNQRIYSRENQHRASDILLDPLYRCS